jgi:hypothetical protein
MSDCLYEAEVRARLARMKLAFADRPNAPIKEVEEWYQRDLAANVHTGPERTQ